jgi:hypothetical protein
VVQAAAALPAKKNVYFRKIRRVIRVCLLAGEAQGSMVGEARRGRFPRGTVPYSAVVRCERSLDPAEAEEDAAEGGGGVG